MKKHISLLLLAAALFTASCSTEPTPPTSDNGIGIDNTVSETTQTEDVDAGISDNLGDFDYGGDEFHMLTRTYVLIHSNLDSSETTGDPLNDAIYDRNRELEERFNVTFKETYYSFADGTNDYPRQFLLAGDTEYDLYTGRMINMFNYAAEQMILPADDIPHIDHTKPYWNAQLYEDLQVAGEHRFVVGDFNLSSNDFTHVLLFNKKLANDYSIENLYDIVRAGNWTYDKFAEISRTTVSDLNGDQKMDETDQYGYACPCNHVLPNFWIAARAELIVKDEDGLLSYIAHENEKVLNVFERIFEMTWDNDVWHSNQQDADGVEIGIFKNNSSLFADASCFQLTTELRDSEVEFGVLPYPKWDSAQDKYYSRIEGCELFGVSYANPNPEMAGVIMEAMACESYNTVRPAYYDVALKTKGTRDENSVEMLDLIFENRVFDYADTILCTEIRDGVLKFAFGANNRKMVSVLTKVEGTCTTALDMYNDGFANHQ